MKSIEGDGTLTAGHNFDGYVEVTTFINLKKIIDK
jgi:hypothetical protein